jgi:hypothetical protein
MADQPPESESAGLCLKATRGVLSVLRVICVTIKQSYNRGLGQPRLYDCLMVTQITPSLLLRCRLPPPAAGQCRHKARLRVPVPVHWHPRPGPGARPGRRRSAAVVSSGRSVPGPSVRVRITIEFTTTPL